MIPIRDINPHKSFAWLTYALIGVNVAVFVHQWGLSHEELEAFVWRFGVVPKALSGGGEGSLITPLTSMFLHGGLLHLLGNMWFLHVFGDNVEYALGQGRFLIFYLLCGLAAAFGQVAIDPQSTVPMIGASGAIAGVLGGYLVLFPGARVLTLVPIFIFLHFIELPAFFFLFVWFGYQLLMGYTSLGDIGASQGGVAFFAHVGGFVAGVVLVRLFRRTNHDTAGFRRSDRHQGRY